MKRILQFGFFILLLLFANEGFSQKAIYSQCDHLIGHDYCYETPTPSLCELDGAMFNTGGFTNTNDPVVALSGNFCGGGTSIENDMWIGFNATQQSMTIEFISSGCSQERGIQAGIFESDCTSTGATYLTRVGNCVNGVIGTFTVSSSSLVPGNDYYILIDGYAGDVCDYTMNVLEGLPDVNFDVTLMPSELCYDNTELFHSTTTLVAVPDPFTPPGGGQYLIEWTASDGGQIVGDTDGYTAEVLTVGTYSVKITDYEFCCTKESSTKITLSKSSPFGTVEDPLKIDCTRSTVTLNGDFTYEEGSASDFAYSWQYANGNNVDDGVGKKSVDVSIDDLVPDGNGDYTFVFSIYNTKSFCLDTVHAIVEVDTMKPLAIPSAAGSLTCQPGESTFDINGDASEPMAADLKYEWLDENDDLIVETSDYTVTTGGIYTLQITNMDNGCVGEASVEIIDDRLLPTANAGTDTYIDCTDAHNTATLHADGTQGTAATGTIKYSWQDVSGNELSTSQDYEATSPGTYTLVVTNDDNGCTVADQIVVEDRTAQPTASIAEPDQITCDIETITLTGSATGATNVKYEWLDKDGFIIGKDATQQVSESGTYTLIVTNNDTGCKDEITKEVTELMTVPTGLFTVDAILTCGDQSVEITGGNGSGSGVTYEWFNSNNASIGIGSSVNVQSTGVYTLVATLTTTGCTASKTATVTPDSDVPNGEIIHNGTTLTCDHESVEIEVSSTTPDATFTWITAPTGANATGTSFTTNIPGDYEVEIENPANGCKIVEVIKIDEDNTPPSVEAGDPDELTCTITEVQLFGTPQTGDPDLVYTWSGPSVVSGADAFNPKVDAAGTYTLTIKNNATGCEATDDVEVTIDIEDPIVDVGADKKIDCMNKSTEVGTNNSSQGADFNYQWTDGGGSPVGSEITYTATAMGDYTLLVTNTTNGCKADETVHVDNDNVAPNNLSINPDRLFLTCDEEESLTAVAFTDGKNPAFSWTGPNDFTASTQDITITDQGDYVLVITNQDNGCSSEVTVSIIDDKKEPGAFAAGGKIPCDPGTFELVGVANPDAINPQFVWSGPAGSLETDKWTIAEPGDYTLLVTGANGCTSEAMVKVVADDGVPSLAVEPIQVLTCVVEKITLDASNSTVDGGGNITYSWFDPSGQPIGAPGPIGIIQVDAPGDYKVEGLNDANGCTTEVIIPVDQDIEEPIAKAGDDQVFRCSDDDITLSAAASTPANNGLDFVWINGNNAEVGDKETYITTESGVFTLMVTDTENGCTATDEVKITPDDNKPIPSATLDGIITCINEKVILDGTNSKVAPTSTGSLEFTWFEGESNLNVSTETIEVSASGTYKLLVKDSENGCEETFTVTVEENKDQPNVKTSAPDQLTCTVDDVPISGEGSKTGDVTYLWERVDGEAGTLTNENDIIANASKEGVYRLIVTDNQNGCTNDLTVEVLADRELPEIETENDGEIDCIDEEVLISGKVTNAPAGTLFDYLWKGAGGFTSTLREVEVTEEGIYVLSVTNQLTNCQDTSSIEVRKKPVIDGFTEIGTDESCLAANSGVVEFGETEGGTAPFMYSIDNGATFTTNPVFAGLAPGDYNIVVQDSKGCEYDKVITIAPFIPGILDLGPDIEIILGDPAQINAALTNINGDTIVWSLDSLTGYNPELYPTESTFIDATVYDENGCAASDRIAIFVKKIRPVYIPSGITPNGDGINDIFTVFSQSAAVKNINSMRIFDRWGTLMFENYNFPPDQPQYGWDGTLAGKHINNAVFGYAIEVQFFDGSVEIYEGDVTILD